MSNENTYGTYHQCTLTYIFKHILYDQIKIHDVGLIYILCGSHALFCVTCSQNCGTHV